MRVGFKQVQASKRLSPGYRFAHPGYLLGSNYGERANDRSPHERSDMRVGFKTSSGFKTG